MVHGGYEVMVMVMVGFSSDVVVMIVTAAMVVVEVVFFSIITQISCGYDSLELNIKYHHSTRIIIFVMKTCILCVLCVLQSIN